MYRLMTLTCPKCGNSFHVETAGAGAAGEALASSLQDHLAQDPSLVSMTGDNGWTLLHQEASAGNPATVRVLLDAGADANAEADNGMTALRIANALGWESVVELLARR